MDAINPAHGSVLRVNSPSLGIFSLRSSSSPVHPASGGSEGGNGEPDEDGRGEWERNGNVGPRSARSLVILPTFPTPHGPTFTFPSVPYPPVVLFVPFTPRTLRSRHSVPTMRRIRRSERRTRVIRNGRRRHTERANVRRMSG